MGTNIYLVKQIKDEDIKKLRTTFDSALKDLKTSRDIRSLIYPIDEAIAELSEEIHICKRSCGWQLLFQSHKELYECTWKSMTDYIKKVLSEGTYIMVDEYGELYSLQDLKDDLKAFSKGWTGATYDAEQRRKGERIFMSVGDHEYISDGLRWTDDEFS